MIINLAAIALAAIPAAIETTARILARRAEKRAQATAAAGGIPGGTPAAPPAGGSPAALTPPETRPEWVRWAGARPELRGWPTDTILAVRGIGTTTPDFRRGLLDLAAELGIPVDSLATIISSESGFRPDALNPLPAAGLIQLTVGAHLAGYDTKEKVQAVAKTTAIEQLSIIRAYYARIRKSAAGANPGKIYMLNFLPDHAGQPADFVLGAKDAPGFSGKVYALNTGLDPTKKGTIQVRDVYAQAAVIAKGAKGKRIAIDGTLTENAQPPAKVALPKGPKTGPTNTLRGALDPTSRAGGLLLLAVTSGRHEAIQWAEIPIGGVIVSVATDAIGVVLEDGPRVRLPASYEETIQICRTLECIAPTMVISDAIYAAAKVRPIPVPLSSGPEMMTVGHAKLHSANIAKFPHAPGEILADVGKDWILHARLIEKGAVNYGWRTPDGKPIQSVGGMHGPDHYDYSQVCRPVKRMAKLVRDGSTVDLLDYLAAEAGGKGLPRKYWDAYR